MDTIVYYSRNRKQPPFEVTIQLEGQVVYINCNCPLGVEKKICRHKINAVRADKQNRHELTSDQVINRLKYLFGITSTLRQHLEEKWRLIREFAMEYPDKDDEIQNKRRILGEAFANGFLNDNPGYQREPIDFDEWHDVRDIYADNLKCSVTLKYVSNEAIATTRDVIVQEVFVSNSRFYLFGFCTLRQQNRTFRVDRIQGIDFAQECNESEKSMLLDVILHGNLPLQP